jgi:hypothetical protein
MVSRRCPDTLEEFREPLFWAGVGNQYREMSWGTVHPTWRERHQMLTEAGFAAIERHFVRRIPPRHAPPGCRPQALRYGGADPGRVRR